MTSDNKTSNETPVLIAVDWGTTSFRAYLMGERGNLLDSRHSTDGIMSVNPGKFAQTLTRLYGEWHAAMPGLPTLMCGMVGSNAGWADVPYLSGRIGTDELAAGLHPVDFGKHPAFIVPGVTGKSLDRHPDVMRGEETILAGAAELGGISEGLVCLPGTHSKWIHVEDRSIAAFSTYMTGELFALLSQNGILSRTFDSETSVDDSVTQSDFDAGVRLARDSGTLAHKLFVLRAGKLTGQKEWRTQNALSGLLVGSEILGAIDALGYTPQSVILVATGSLGAAYRRALDLLEVGHRYLDAENCVRQGLWNIHKASKT